jgi:hypothetical protein
MLGQSIGSSWRVECLAIYILVPLMCVVRAALRLGVEIATRRSATGSALQQFSLTCWHLMLGSSQWFVIHAHTLPTTIGACRSVHQAKHSESQFVRSRGRDGEGQRGAENACASRGCGCGLELMNFDVALWILRQVESRAYCTVSIGGRWHISGHLLLHRPLFGMVGQPSESDKTPASTPNDHLLLIVPGHPGPAASLILRGGSYTSRRVGSRNAALCL